MQDDKYTEIGLKNRWTKQIDVVADVRRQAFASFLYSVNTYGLIYLSNLN